MTLKSSSYPGGLVEQHPGHERRSGLLWSRQAAGGFEGRPPHCYVPEKPDSILFPLESRVDGRFVLCPRVDPRQGLSGTGFPGRSAGMVPKRPPRQRHHRRPDVPQPGPLQGLDALCLRSFLAPNGGELYSLVLL
jgi:hypothetical protein